jgi:hypothetical protein
MLQIAEAPKVGDVPSGLQPMIWNLLSEVAEHRPLTPAEVRWRRLTAPRAWRNDGIDRSTWYRRRKRALLAAEVTEAV